jgi:methyl-accepting chemotaxis protein
MSQERPRRIILIDSRFQLRLAGAFVVLQVVLTGAFAFGLYVFMDSELQAGLASAHAAYRSLDQMLLPLVLILAGFSLVLSTALVTAFVVILSHRIAGPLYRFRTVMEELANRRLAAHTRLRPDDQLGALSEPTGQALDTLRTDFTALRTDLDRAQAALAAGDLATTTQALADLEGSLSRWSPGNPTPVR